MDSLSLESDSASLATNPQAKAGIERRLSLIVVILVVLGAALCTAAFVAVFAKTPTTQTFQKWEYRIEDVPDASFDTAMQKIGEEGWEVVFARRASDGSTYSPKFSYEVILKRPKQDSATSAR